MSADHSTSQTHPSRTWIRAAAWVAMGVSSLVLSFIFVRFTIDDAFITWRYGANLVEHGVWNWNPNTVNLVEAYTNPIYAALSIVPAAVGMSPELFFKFVSLAILALLGLTLLRTQTSPWQKVAMGTMIAFNPVFWIHLYSGLETPLFVALLVVVFGRLYTRGSLGSLGYVAAIALCVTRPEGIGFALAAMAWQFCTSPGRHHLRPTALWLGGFIVYWLVRWNYFGPFWPNTFYVKTGDNVATGANLKMLISIGVGLGILVLVLALGEVLRRAFVQPVDRADGESRPPRRWHRYFNRHQTPALLALLAAAVEVLVYGRSNLLMNYGDRFHWQLIMPVLLVTLMVKATRVTAPWQAISLTLIGGMIAINFDRGVGTIVWVLVGVGLALAVYLWAGFRRSTAALCLATLAMCAAASWLRPASFLGLATYRVRLEHAHGELGRILQENRAKVGAISLGDAGLIPIRYGGETIDDFGLANRAITTRTFNYQTVKKIRPEVVIVTSYNGRLLQMAKHPAKKALESPEPGRGVMRLTQYWAKQNNYEVIHGPQMSSSYGLILLVNPDLPETTKQDLRDLARKSRANSSVPSNEYFRDHITDFPFLRD